MAHWKQFFDITREESKQVALCKLCSETIHAAAGVSSNLIRHLKRKHEREYAQREKGLSSQPKITSSFAAGCSSLPAHRKAALDDAIINMVCTDMEPFRIVERVGFKQFVKVSLRIL